MCCPAGHICLKYASLLTVKMFFVFFIVVVLLEEPSNNRCLSLIKNINGESVVNCANKQKWLKHFICTLVQDVFLWIYPQCYWSYWIDGHDIWHKYSQKYDLQGSNLKCSDCHVFSSWTWLKSNFIDYFDVCGSISNRFEHFLDRPNRKQYLWILPLLIPPLSSYYYSFSTSNPEHLHHIFESITVCLLSV